MKKTLVALGLALAAQSASAATIDAIGSLAQGEFRKFSEDMGAALSYKALAPAEPLGITGFDVGVETTVTTLKNKDLFNMAASGTELSAVPVPKLHVHKGLPFNIDVGGFYASIPDSNISLTGLELRYAFIEGGIAMPALALRGTMSTLSGVDQLDLQTTGVELSISKGFAMLTPYAGLGQVWVTSTPKGVSLQEESFTLPKTFVGLNINFGLMNIAIEGDQTGDASTWGAKLGVRF